TPPSLKSLAPSPCERGEGWGEGLVPSNCRALVNSPLPDPLTTSPSWGEGIRRGLGGGIKTRCSALILPSKPLLVCANIEQLGGECSTTRRVTNSINRCPQDTPT